jgi:predicted dehydrogenase
MIADGLGVGVIGLGVGEQHALAFAANPHCRLVALCDADAGRLAQVARALSPAKTYQRAAELIDDPDVEIVSVASNDDDHAEHVVRALRLGKHVFAEKPLCLDRKSLDEIVSAWRNAKGARLSTNTVLRRSPRFRWLKGAIDAGKFGTLFCIEGDYLYGRLHKLATGWRGRIRDYSVVLGGGIHVVDLLLWLSGQRPVEVTAYGSKLGSVGSGFDGTDLVLALLTFESGLIAKIGANFAAHYQHFHRLTVYGTEATFENLPGPISASARVWKGRDDGVPPTAIDKPYPSVEKGALIPSFVDAVLGRGLPDVTESDVFACVAVCLAIDRSVAERRAVRVDYEEF